MSLSLSDFTVVIIAHNEAENLQKLLPNLRFAGQILILDNHSTDDTSKIAKKFSARYCACDDTSFAALRQRALDLVTTDWLFYLDADERVTPALVQELSAAAAGGANAIRLRRQDICYGYPLRHGGWDQDFVTRIFRRSHLRGWEGEIHESPVFDVPVVTLDTPLIHLTHRHTAANLRKSAAWTIKEAQLFVDHHTAPVTPATILRKTWMEFYRRFFRQRGYKDGTVGFIESFVQACNRGFVYIQIWELQQQPSLTKRYQKEEAKIDALWQKVA